MLRLRRCVPAGGNATPGLGLRPEPTHRMQWGRATLAGTAYRSVPPKHHVHRQAQPHRATAGPAAGAAGAQPARGFRRRGDARARPGSLPAPLARVLAEYARLGCLVLFHGERPDFLQAEMLAHLIAQMLASRASSHARRKARMCRKLCQEKPRTAVGAESAD